MRSQNTFLILLALAALVGGALYFTNALGSKGEATMPSGTVTVALGETGQVGNMTIQPLQVENDSRCHTDVTCIQAGTVKLSVAVDKKNYDFTLGTPVAVEGVRVTLSQVAPDKNSKKPIRAADYRFTFTVGK